MSISYLLDQACLPILNVGLLVCCTHELLLHREIANVLLLECLDEKPDAALAVLRFHENHKFFLHHALELILLLSRAENGAHSLEGRHFLFDSLLLTGEFRSENHIGLEEHVVNGFDLVALCLTDH